MSSVASPPLFWLSLALPEAASSISPRYPGPTHRYAPGGREAEIGREPPPLASMENPVFVVDASLTAAAGAVDSSSVAAA